jgi:metal-dependent amidase/aminoacylase/carboxypeptidase family protein
VGATYDFDYLRRYPVTVNDAAEASYVAALAAKTLGASRSVEFERTMGAEDFSFMLEQRPGCFFFVGVQSGPATAVAHHSAKFAIDERCLEAGVRMMTALALDAPIVARA